MALTCPLDLHQTKGTIARVNATIIIERLSVINIELMNGITTPVYGVVDKVVLGSNVETHVMGH